MKKVIFFTFFTTFSALVSAQQSKKDLAHFTVIDAFGPFEIELIKSDHESIDINYRGIKSEDLIVDVHNEVLKLKIKNRHFINEWKSSSNDYYRNDDYVKVKIYYKDIDAIEIEAGSKVFSRETLKSKNLELIANMGAEVDLELLSQNVGIQSSMGAIIKLSGRTENLEIRTSMGTEIRTTSLKAKKAYIKASMGSAVRVSVTDEIDASAGWGAVIDYEGGPTVHRSSTSMGAEIYNRRHH
jgi:hypothetical protein